MSRQLIGSAPLFHITNLAKSLDFYCDILGFDRPTLWGDPPGFAMPQRDGMIVMLDQQEEAPLHNKGNWDAYFWVNDAQRLYDEFKAKGAIFEYGVEFKELYGNLEFALKDPDGYFLAFGQTLTDEELKNLTP